MLIANKNQLLKIFKKQNTKGKISTGYLNWNPWDLGQVFMFL